MKKGKTANVRLIMKWKAKKITEIFYVYVIYMFLIGKRKDFILKKQIFIYFLA